MRISIIPNKEVILYTYNKFYLSLACQNLRLVHVHVQRKAITVGSTLTFHFSSKARKISNDWSQ